MAGRRRRERPTVARRGPALLSLGASALLLTATLLGSGTRAAWTSGRVVDATASAATSRLIASHAWGASTCSASGPSDATCAGSPLPAGASSSTTQTQSDTLTNSTGGSTAGSASFTQQVQVSSCAPAQFTNARTSTDPLLPRYGVTRQAGDRWGTAAAASFDGATNYATDVVATSTASQAGTSYSLGLWFRATAGSNGGGLLSLNASPVASTTLGANPALYVDTSGRVRARLDATPVLVIPVILGLASPTGTDYRDGVWHQVTLTVNRKVLTTDIVLYVDGAQVDAITGTSLLVGTLTSSYWHVGWTDTTALPGTTTDYFAGRLSGVFVQSSVLSAASVAALASSASASVYAALLAGAQHLWMLGDAATVTHTSAVPYVSGNGLPCSKVRLGWTLGASTAFALTPLDQLAGAGWSPSVAAAAPGAGATQTLTSSYARLASGYDANVAGLELVVAVAHRLSLIGSAWSLRFDWPAAGVIA